MRHDKSTADKHTLDGAVRTCAGALAAVIAKTSWTVASRSAAVSLASYNRDHSHSSLGGRTPEGS